jgi:hypothetical protein
MASDRIQTTITCPACTEEITIPTRAQWHGDGTGTVTFDTSAVRAHIAQHHTEQEHPVTRFALDTEFIEDGRTIDLVSIALVAEDGRELYAVSSKFSQAKLLANPWLAENVWPSLPTVKHGKGVTCRCINGNKYGHLDLDHPDVRPRAQIARMVRDFVLGTDPDMLPHVELWADYSAYDHVALAQLYGRMSSRAGCTTRWRTPGTSWRNCATSASSGAPHERPQHAVPSPARTRTRRSPSPRRRPPRTRRHRHQHRARHRLRPARHRRRTRHHPPRTPEPPEETVTDRPNRKTDSPAARTAAWTLVSLLGAVLASAGVYAIVWIWTRTLAMVG